MRRVAAGGVATSGRGVVASSAAVIAGVAPAGALADVCPEVRVAARVRATGLAVVGPGIIND